jgi:hypothetical protein
VVRWWRGAAPAPSPGERQIATAGDALWSRAPWPVAEELFALPACPEPGRTLVVEADPAVREGAVAALHARGIPADGVARLTAGALAGADVVVHGIAGGPLPGDAYSVLAAGRVLIADPDPGFGLLGGIDYLVAGDHPLACDLVESLRAAPAAYAGLRRRARIAAERHRAPAVYARLLTAL